ncbi:hypothetical protein ACLOJK_036706 [Asimina triloba]
MPGQFLDAINDVAVVHQHTSPSLAEHRTASIVGSRDSTQQIDGRRHQGADEQTVTSLMADKSASIKMNPQPSINRSRAEAKQRQQHVRGRCMSTTRTPSLNTASPAHAAVSSYTREPTARRGINFGVEFWGYFLSYMGKLERDNRPVIDAQPRVGAQGGG